MSHPTLGLPPRDLTAGNAAAAAAIEAARSRVAARALEVAVDGDPGIRTRYSELALRELLADVEAYAGRLSVALASGDPLLLGAWAEQVAPRYRKRSVPMDDMIRLSGGLRAAAGSVIPTNADTVLDAAIDAAIAVFKWHRRLAGDARKKNPFIQFIYKGA